MKIQKVHNLKTLSLLILIISGCSLAPKDEMSSSADPREEIERLSADLDSAQEKNIDVLARNDYQRSVKYFEKSKKDLEGKKAQEAVINDLRYARQALKEAYKTAGPRNEQLPQVFTARQRAIRSGVYESAKLKEDMTEIDEDLAKQADRLERLSPKTVDRFQTAYVELEKNAVIEWQLGKAISQVNGARVADADEKAPKAFRAAEMSLKNAEISIGANIRSRVGFQTAVNRANQDAIFLSDVMKVIQQNGNSLSETAATQIVLQRQKISSLETDVTKSEKALTTVQDRLGQEERNAADGRANLAERDADLNRAQGRIDVQQALEKSRSQFSKNEAEAYQQGDNLLIRLKSMNFEVGRSEVPATSTALLAKVLDVAKTLNAQQITVEGHTDSVGTAELNQKLSEDRAKSVASYLKSNGVQGTEVVSEGKGFENPIASNKSKAGRAQNRRVDILITPMNQ